MTTPPTPATPIPAATVMLLRDGPGGLEVLMMVRHGTVNFAGGAMVFPGGKVAPADRIIAAGFGEETEALVFKIAAIRETFEECGILLARKTGSEAVLSAEEVAAVLVPEAADADFAALLATNGLAPAADLLVPFAHWITPAVSPKRFDTHFFVADVSSAQIARYDGHEAVEVAWMTPKEAVEAADSGVRTLLPPTYLNLKKLGSSGTVAAALDAARRTPIVTVSPELVHTETGSEMRIPEAAGYGVTSFSAGPFARK